jgi:D-alanyl-D-alanine endopeptidase (penicillin-binding protein 7)
VAEEVRSLGAIAGLRAVTDPLLLKSSVAFVMDQNSGEVLYEKNPQAVLPIASITKLMTAMVVLDSGLSLTETLEIGDEDRDTIKHTGSRLAYGTRLSRAEMLNLALMSSENRAAHALGRHYPGGLAAFIDAMNEKARSLGMTDTKFFDPTGLSRMNVSTSRDLAAMVRSAYDYPLIREYSTAIELTVNSASRLLRFKTTNGLVSQPDWEIGLQKTGYISEAGKCLVMQAKLENRSVIMVLLDAAGSAARWADALRLRKMVESGAKLADISPSRITNPSLSGTPTALTPLTTPATPATPTTPGTVDAAWIKGITEGAEPKGLSATSGAD